MVLLDALLQLLAGLWAPVEQEVVGRLDALVLLPVGLLDPPALQTDVLLDFLMLRPLPVAVQAMAKCKLKVGEKVCK